MNIKYYLADPTGNITLLVESPVEENKRPETALNLMKIEPSAEQVGFLAEGDSECDIILNMAGGEFCANATLSAAAVFCLNNKLSSGTIRVKVSGENTPVLVEMSGEENGIYSGTVNMPLPMKIEERELESDGFRAKYPAVFFDGIVHIISFYHLKKEVAERAAEKWCRELSADALGIMQIDPEIKTILPLVYVHKARTLFWESSCASGTAAVGAYLCNSSENGFFEGNFSEPAGKLKIAAEEKSLRLTGKVKVLREQEAFC